MSDLNNCGAGTAILPEHLGSPTVFSGVHVARSLVLCVCFVLLLFFFFWSLCCLSSLICGFLLPLWYLWILITSLVFVDSDYLFGICGF